MRNLEISRIFDEDNLKSLQIKDGSFESLLGETSNLIQLISGDYMLFFDIHGEVRIGDSDGERCFNISEDKKLQEEIKLGNIYDSDNYNIWDNNWFEIFIFKGDSEINNFVYEGDAKTIEELLNELEEYLIEEIKENREEL